MPYTLKSEELALNSFYFLEQIQTCNSYKVAEEGFSIKRKEIWPSLTWGFIAYSYWFDQFLLSKTKTVIRGFLC